MNGPLLRILLGALLSLASFMAWAAPGDVLFSDNFERSNPGIVGNGWTVTSGACTGTLPTSTITISGSGSTSVSGITVNGVQIMSGATNASSNTGTVADRVDAAISLNGFTATSPGSTVVITGPAWASGHTPVITQSGGMVLTVTAFSGGNSGCAGIDSDVPPWTTPINPRANPTRAMFTRWSAVTVTSPVINLAGKAAAQVTYWVRRGSDCFSEWPGNNSTGCNVTLAPYTSLSGEEFVAQYRNSAGTWVTISQFVTDGPPGEIFRPVIDLPADALHANFQLRFNQPGGSGTTGSGGAPGVVGYDYWHVDDVVVTEKSQVSYSGAFCDTFEGDLSRWSVTGTGNASIGSTYFQKGAHGMDIRWRTVTVASMPTDITGVTGNISFWLRRGTGNLTQVPNTTGSDKPEAGEDLVVEYLTTAGTWAYLVPASSFLGSGTGGQIYCPAVDTNCTTATPTTNDIPIPANANRTAFQMRFRLLGGSGYDMDYWHLDNVCVGGQVQPTDLALALVTPVAGSTTTLAPGQTSTLTYTVTNNGPNTEPGPLTITASLPAGLNYVSTSSPGWTCSTTGVLTCTRAGPLGVGASTSLVITVQADLSASGSNLANTATVGGQTLDTNAANNVVTNYYSFVAPAFEAYETSTTAGATLGRIYTKLAGTPFTLSVIAVNSGAISTGYNRTATVDLIDGSAACAVGTAALTGVTVTPSTYTYTGAGAGRDNGLKTFSFTVANAYRNVKVRIRDNNGAIGCSSDVFAVRPSSFNLVSGNANADNTGLSTTAAPTVAAGTAFSLTATAVDGVSSTLSGYDGLPVLDPVQLQAHVGAPVAGVLAGAFNQAVSGVASGAAFNYSEVGYFRLAAGGVHDDLFTSVDQSTDCTNDFSNTLDASGKYGCKFANVAATAYFGRFIPDHFDTVVAEGCAAGAFTYSAQPFALTVTARNQAGAATQNYHGTGAPVLAKALTLSDANASGAGALAPLAAAATTFTNGVANLTPSYTFNNRQTAPTAIGLRAVESAGGDGVSSATGAEGTTTIRSGRVQLLNAYGSEQLDLPMTLRAEFWNGAGWAANAADTCTGNVALGAANAIGIIFSAANPAGLPACVLDTGNPGASGAGCVAPGALARRFRLGGTLQQGNFNLWLNRTLLTGFVTVTANVPAWLEFNWNGAGNGDPTARATFGTYRSPLIYRRENY